VDRVSGREILARRGRAEAQWPARSMRGPETKNAREPLAPGAMIRTDAIDTPFSKERQANAKGCALKRGPIRDRCGDRREGWTGAVPREAHPARPDRQAPAKRAQCRYTRRAPRPFWRKRPRHAPYRRLAIARHSLAAKVQLVADAYPQPWKPNQSAMQHGDLVPESPEKSVGMNRIRRSPALGLSIS